MRKTNTVMFTKYLAEWLSIALKQPEAGPQTPVLVFKYNYFGKIFYYNAIYY